MRPSRRCLLRLCAATGLTLCFISPARPAMGAAGRAQIFVEPGAHLTPILHFIESAHRTLDVGVYLLTDRSVIDAFEQAQQSGVRVRVLLEEYPYRTERYARSAYGTLHQAGISVRWANESAFRYTHEKAMVADGREAAILTDNLTYSGITRNREFGIIDNDLADARAVDAIFQADWNRRAIAVHDSRLVVSPLNSRSRLRSLIDSARHTLDLYEEEVADDDIQYRLEAAARRGVRVRLLVSSGSSGVDALRGSGISVRLLTHPYIHAKAMIVDGRTVFVGSENLSTISLDRNREMGIVLSDSSVVATLQHTFATDWSGANP